MSSVKTWEKDPSAVLDWEFNWSKWMADGDYIVSAVATPQSGITVDSTVPATDKVTVWISGGTTDVSYRVSCRITTAQGRVDERTIQIAVRER